MAFKKKHNKERSSHIWLLFSIGKEIKFRGVGDRVDIKRPAKAGSMESSDIYIMVQPNHEEGMEIELDSIVMKQFGTQIRLVIEKKLMELEVKNIKLTAKDRGALDYTIEARVETAIKRAI